VLSFAADIHPIFEANCGPCHTTNNFGGHNVADDDVDAAYDDAIALGMELLNRIDGGGMPQACQGEPGDTGCLTVAQVELVRTWMEQGSEE
jgi:hypothetical protein